MIFKTTRWASLLSYCLVTDNIHKILIINLRLNINLSNMVILFEYVDYLIICDKFYKL